jgi:hypothetical protein
MTTRSARLAVNHTKSRLIPALWCVRGGALDHG